MRANRLIAIVLLLQRHERLTAAQLARELEISVATARRDLEALSGAGVPVYPQPGRGGGWQLVGGARTDLSGLTGEEAGALFSLIGPLAGANTATRTAVRKLVQALPESLRDEAELTAAATLHDRSSWGQPADALYSSHREQLQQAVLKRQVLRLSYNSPRGSFETTVHPLGLVTKHPHHYLLAHTSRGCRSYRLDRITDACGTDETFERPRDFDLDRAWAEVVAHSERQRSTTSAQVQLASNLVWVLQRQFGRHCEVLSQREGLTAVQLAASSTLDLARQLAGWGNQLTVLEPAELQRELARIGAELLQSYAVSTQSAAPLLRAVRNS